jgi:ATP synthase protein I
MNDLDSIRKRLNKLKTEKTINDLKNTNNKLDPFSIATELVAGVLVGIITGVFFDKMFDSKPLFIIICLTLGIIASGRIIWQKINNSIKNGS